MNAFNLNDSYLKSDYPDIDSKIDFKMPNDYIEENVEDYIIKLDNSMFNVINTFTQDEAYVDSDIIESKPVLQKQDITQIAHTMKNQLQTEKDKSHVDFNSLFNYTYLIDIITKLFQDLIKSKNLNEILNVLTKDNNIVIVLLFIVILSTIIQLFN